MSYDSPKTLAEAEHYEALRHPPREPKPDTRGKSKHWKVREIRATFQEFYWRFDKRENRQVRCAVLRDVYLDGVFFTHDWRVDCPKSLQALCHTPGCVVTFQAPYSETAYAAKKAGFPLLRPPYVAVTA